MKKLTILFLFIPFFAHAQNTFKAIVKDSLTHEQLAGSTAILKGSTKGSSTGQNGEIVIKNIPDGKQTVVFSNIGYKNLERTFIFPLPDSLQGQTIYLKPQSEELEEVIVTSTRTNSRIENIPVRIQLQKTVGR